MGPARDIVSHLCGGVWLSIQLSAAALFVLPVASRCLLASRTTQIHRPTGPPPSSTSPSPVSLRPSLPSSSPSCFPQQHRLGLAHRSNSLLDRAPTLLGLSSSQSLLLVIRRLDSSGFLPKRRSRAGNSSYPISECFTLLSHPPPTPTLTDPFPRWTPTNTPHTLRATTTSLSSVYPRPIRGTHSTAPTSP